MTETKKPKSALSQGMFKFVKKHNIKAIAIIIDGEKNDLATHWSYSFSEVLGLSNYLKNVIEVKNAEDQAKFISANYEKELAKGNKKSQIYMG